MRTLYWSPEHLSVEPSRQLFSLVMLRDTQRFVACVTKTFEKVGERARLHCFSSSTAVVPIDEWERVSSLTIEALPRLLSGLWEKLFLWRSANIAWHWLLLGYYGSRNVSEMCEHRVKIDPNNQIIRILAPTNEACRCSPCLSRTITWIQDHRLRRQFAPG